MRVVLSLAAVCLLLLVTPAFADCAQDVRAVMDSALASGPLNIITVSQAGDIKTASSIDVLSRDAIQALTAEDGVPTETILLQGQGWAKQAGQWVQLEPSAMEHALATDRSVIEYGPAVTDTICSGTVVVEGTPYIGYSFRYERGGEHSEQTILTDPNSGLIQQILVRSHPPEGTVRSIRKISYVPDMVIKAPQL